MNNLNSTIVKKQTKEGMVICATILGIAIAVLIMQSIKYTSSVWVVLKVGFEEWQKFLLPMLESLLIWAMVTGIIFAVEYVRHPPKQDVKKFISSAVSGSLPI